MEGLDGFKERDQRQDQMEVKTWRVASSRTSTICSQAFREGLTQEGSSLYQRTRIESLPKVP